MAALHFAGDFSIFFPMATGQLWTPELLRTELAGRRRRELPDGSLVRAAVLIPMVPRGGDFDLLLTRRTEDVETHKGQVAFPGGMRDAADRSPVDTALREAEEEVGIARERVNVAGLLDDMETPTGFVITPVAGFLPNADDVVPNAAEVASIFLSPLSFFADGRNARRETRRLRGKDHEVFFYEHGGHLIWGVTAAIIRSLVAVLEGAQLATASSWGMNRSPTS